MPAVAVRVHAFDLIEVPMRTRMPFRYGIATLTELPHLIARLDVEIAGRIVRGFAADGLAPKWFTKDPARAIDDEIAEMRAVIRSACARAVAIGNAESAFDLWRAMEVEAKRPALLANFGASFVERGVIDAICRGTGQTLADAIRNDSLGIRLGDMHAELRRLAPAELLPARLSDSIVARHTVGLSDALSEGEIAPGDRIDDGLPQSLEAAIAAYGLTHFKLKLAGEVARDLARLREVSAVALKSAGEACRFTLDANENYRSMELVRELWDRLAREPVLAPLLERVLFVEQPLHRDAALSAAAGEALARWAGHPALIIDESDDSLDALPRALELGYAGTSHKNCKGVFKGIANACLIAKRSQQASRRLILSGEDLSTVGPISLLQDLAMQRAMGVEHGERNGHHYFRGLSAFAAELQRRTAEAHPDLYRMHEHGFAAAMIRGGRMSTASAGAAPFGTMIEPV